MYIAEGDVMQGVKDQLIHGIVFTCVLFQY